MSTSPAIPPLDGTLGAIEVGVGLSTYLFGIETLQTYYYFRNFPEDSLWLKMIVGLVWFLELGHTISVWHAIYSVTVTFFCQPQHIQSPPLSLEMTLIFALLINATVQLFFTNRIRVLSRKWLLPVLCCTLAIMRSIFTIVLTKFQIQNQALSTLQQKYRWLMILALTFGLAVDVAVTSSLCYWLKRIPASRFEKTERMIDTLVMWSVESGLITSTASAIILILFLTRNDAAWFPFFLVQGKLYSNSLLASLNGREQFRSAAALNVSGPAIEESIVFNRNRSRQMVVEMSHMTETDSNIFSKDTVNTRGSS